MLYKITAATYSQALFRSEKEKDVRQEGARL